MPETKKKVGLVLGAGGVMGGAWHTGALHALATETGWDPGSADYIVGTSAGSMMGSLVAAGIPPWFMVAHSAGAVFRLHRGLPPLGPGSLRMALRTLANPLRYTPIQLMIGWAPVGLVSTESLKETVRRAVPSGWAGHPNFWAVASDYASGKRVPFGRIDSPSADLADA